MKKIFYLPIVAIVAGLLFCTACKKEKTEEDSKKREVINKEDPQPYPDPEPNIATILLGSWQEDKQTSFMYTDDDVIDTITFTSDGIVFETDGIFDHYEYQLLNDTTITFSSYRDYDDNPRFSIPFNIRVYCDSNKYKITFYNFIHRRITQDVKNITYTKIQ